MVTTLTLPSSALGFTLDSNNQYIISVTLVMKEIIKMVASLNSSVSLYLRHHNIKYKYIFYINGTAWKSSNGYTNLTNTNVSFSNENISGYLSSSSLKQTLSCTVEVSHPQFYCKLNSENYTFVTINKKPQQLKAKNASTGQYETIGLSFSNLSSSEKSGIDSVRWPLFNTENSSQQFVIPIGSASYTRRNGSIRAERFGGSAGQYFNLDTNPSSNKDYRANNGTEYRYVDSFTPALRYYTEYTYFRDHSYSVYNSYDWSNGDRGTAPTLTTGENIAGRYTSYSFSGWWRSYTFIINYFTYDSVYAPNAVYSIVQYAPNPNFDNLPESAFGFYFDIPRGAIYTFGRDFTVNYRDALKYENSTSWPAYESFIKGGSVTLGSYARYGSNWVFDRCDFIEGRKDYYYCVGRYYNKRDREEYYNTSIIQPYFNFHPSGTEQRGYLEFSIPVQLRYYYDGEDYHGVPTGERYYLSYGVEAVRYRTERYSVYKTDQTGFSLYEKFFYQYKHPFISTDFYLYTTYTTKTLGISSTIHGTENEYRAWWDYETRTNWYIDSNNNIQYYNSSQVKITNDTDTYRTS